MRPIRFLSLALLAASLASITTTPVLAQSAETDTGAVALRFGWTAPMRARVGYEQLRVRTSQGRSDTLRAAIAYTLVAEPHPEGMLVRTDSLDWTRVPTFGAGGGPYLEQLGGTLFFPPRYVVSAGGRFVRAEGTVQNRTMAMALATRVIARNIRGAPPHTMSALDQLVTGTLVEAMARTDWNSQVDMWMGETLVPGREVAFEAEQASPIAPDIAIPVRSRVVLSGRLPCVAGSGRADCVRLEMTTTPDPEAFRAAIRGAIGGVLSRAGLPPSEAERFVREAAMEDVTTSVMEPGTLRPHVVTIRRTMTLLDPAATRPVPVTITDQRTYRYTYPANRS